MTNEPIEHPLSGGLHITFVPMTKQRSRGWCSCEVMPATVVGRNWSMAVGDLNGDGKDDGFIGGWGAPARLLLTK